MTTFYSHRFVNPHCHLRDIPSVMEDLITLALGGGVSVLGPMPNTTIELINAELVEEYIRLAKSLVPTGLEMSFIPIGYLTESSTIADIDAFLEKNIRNVKIYPFDRTTNSEHGVKNYSNLLELVRYGGTRGMIFHFHPEHPWMLFENRDAEFMFLPIIYMFIQNTQARIVWEHGTDARCIPFWKEMAKTGRFYLTLTAHHLATDESACFGDRGAICKPSIKTMRDRVGLVQLVSEDHSWVMAGADDAPHNKSKKDVPSGQKCACGASTTSFLPQLYAHALDDLLQKPCGSFIFQRFTSTNAQVLHNLQPIREKITLVRESWTIPQELKVGDWTVENFWGGRKLLWSLVD